MAEFFFGIASGLRATSPEILLKGIGIQALKAKLFRIEKIEAEEEDATSYLGTPIFDPIIIKGGSFFELDDINKENPIPYPDADGAEGNGLIIPAVIIEVSQSKNIITTAIQGRNGTVKEFVSDGDFAITLTGVIIGRNEGGEVKDIGNVYPTDDVKKLVTICKVPDVLTLTSAFLNDVFGINEVVITDYNIPQREASRDMQPFQISMLSDVPIDLEELTTE
ncbi:hypothetical protein LCGC14_0771000 [marine sediment metagenome]|uniref:DUF6046 domain-containing protein n=1 Tax=marine sediment metagenome TaxID=412755 RepID=A0A0F9QI37_9ZZZZ